MCIRIVCVLILIVQCVCASTMAGCSAETESAAPPSQSANVSTPVYDGSHYANPPHFNFTMPSFGAVMKFLWTRSELDLPGEQVLNEALPIRQPQFVEPSVEDDTVRATWLGHATVLVQMQGVTFITDPVWCHRCSPISVFGPPRYRPPPIAIDQLPRLDFALVSHNHYDHLDADAHLHWFVPTGLASTIRSMGARNVTELSWTDSVEWRSEVVNGAGCKVTCVPAKHWSLRNGFDRFKTLWSGWAVSTSNRRFYFAGDTGFCEQEFAAIGRQYGPFDLAAIPIGCYEPRAFMRAQHVDPEEAVKIHQLVGAKRSIGIHWGTYKMGSKEFYLAPKTRLLEVVRELLNSTEEFTAPDHGETIIVE